MGWKTWPDAFDRLKNGVKMSDRFGFGKNWKQFLGTMNEDRRLEAIRSLSEWINTDSLEGKTFLDIGTGSGLFSLAARDMGAEVHSFDYDMECVECARTLKKRYHPDDEKWTIERGDILDKAYMSQFAAHDIVYSWGVLHHTGNMYGAFENAGEVVKKGGLLFIAIYNDQGLLSSLWKIEKRIYNRLPAALRFLVAVLFFTVLWMFRSVVDLIRIRPFETYRRYKKKRGMSPWYDAVDWVGGYPFEVAKPEEILEFFRSRGFELIKMSTNGGSNRCNQFVFRKAT